MLEGIQVVGTPRDAGDLLLEILRADVLWRRLNELTAGLGFHCWTYSAVPIHPMLSGVSLRVTTYPLGHVKKCVSHNLYPHCPALAFSYQNRLPTVYRV